MAVATGIELLTGALCQPITGIDMLKNIEQGNYEKAAALGLSTVAGVKELIDDAKRPWWQDAPFKRLTALALIPNFVVDMMSVQQDIKKHGFPQFSTVLNILADVAVFVGLRIPAISVPMAIVGIGYTMLGWKESDKQKRRDNFNEFYQYLNTKEAQDYMKCPYCLDIQISSPTVYETEGIAKFTITLDKELKEDLRLDLFTVEGTATEDKDYEGVKKYKNSITIPAGETSYEYTVKIASDGKYEDSENFLLVAEPIYSGIDVLSLPKYISALATILDFPQEECPKTPKPNIKPISLNLPPTPVYPTTGGGGGSLGPGGSWSGGGSWGSGGYYPSIPSKPSLPNVPYIECYNEPYLNSMMIVKLPSLNSTRSFVALNYMSKDNSFNLSSPLLKDSPNSLNNKTLDLNTTTSNSNKIYFDMNSDGFKEKMIEWMNEDEAVLVNDINNNGLIDNGTEILGNNYISNLTGSKSLDSYLLLKEFDKNKDGVIDIKDNSNLALWQDKNKNGITDKGELTYIGKDNSPIKSISINPLDTLLSAYDRNHDFKIDNKDIIYNYIYYKDNFDNSIDLYIYGDDSAKSFLDFDTTNHTILTNQGIKRVNEIHFYTDELNLNNIANGDNLNNKLVGNSYANKLYGNGGDDILEGLDGNDTLDGGSGNDKLYGGAGNDTLRGGKGNDLLDGGSWDDRYIFSKGDGIDIIRDSHGNDIIEFDESIKLEDLIVKSNGKDLNISIKSNNTNLLSNQIIIKNYYGNGRIERVKFSDDKVLEVSDIISMMGTNKDDIIYLTNTSQTIYAKDGKDTIYAGSGNNTIIGGKGDDKIFGSYGSDTYIYTKGDGNDIIQDSGGKDTILVKDINSNEVEFIRSTNSLILKFDDNNSITIVNYFIDNNRIESFKFEDKAIVPNDIINSFITDGNDNIIGTDDGDTLDGKGGNDTIIGLRGNDTLIGGDGDDKLYGNDGNDILKGLAGSDYMDGGNGDDTYIYNLGDGNDKIYDGGGKDKIKFGDGISKDDLKFRKNRNNLIVTIKGESTIEILNFFTKSGVIEGFIFNNESVMPSSEIANLFSYSFGGKDTLYAQDGSTLIGEKGDDVYIYQRGDGRVIIDDSFIESNIVVEAGNDTLKLIGIDKDDIVLTKYGNDMVIFINDENGKTTSDETIVIKNFSNPLKGIEKIEFDDKSTIEIDKNGKYPSASFSSKNSYYLVYGSEDNDIKGTSSSYTYELGAGDDKIVASSYHDTIIGGAGDDVLEGGSGNDTYIFNKGDGKDIIFDAAGDDFIKFGDGISKNDIAVRVIGDTLYVGIKESGVKFSDYSDRITIRNWVSSNNRVEKFIFRDGEVIDYNQIISMAGTDENDTISTFQNSNDTINALGGDDTINSYDGDDIIDGGAGDDIIDGGLGNDTYIFKKGMGRDIITDSSGIDTMKVVDNLNISEVAYKRVGDDLVVYIDEDGVDESNYKDGARVKGWFKSISNRVEFIEFADGRVIRPENITKFTNSNDNLTLGDEDNIIHALDGDDTIYAGGGNDILDGGKGNDTLYGEKGNDTYLFGRGDGNDIIDDYDGNDTLEFKDGITPDDIVIYYENNQKYNLIVALKEDGKSLNELSDKVILKNWYSYSYRIENLKFADGTIWNVSEIQKHINTDGNDIIYGIGNYRSSDTWNDILTGGKGDDTLYGYDGNDTYIFNKGDGKDTIIDNSGTDTLRLGEGIRENDIIIQKSGNDVKIYIKEDGKELSKLSDVITLKDWYNANNKIENIELSDGTKIDYSSLFDPTNSNDNLTLGDEDNIIHALDGDDTIYAGGGNDILDGGKGNDTLYGEKGNDTYLFGRGDGNDIIDDYDGNDTLEFKDGITPDDIVIYYENNQKYNLIVALKEDGKSLNELSDKVILKNWYSYSYRIENLKFADGTIWNVSEIQKHINTDGNDIIYGIGNYRSSDTWNDILTGGKGDDTLYGYDGNDTYIFNKGDGKDTIIDNSGTDTLRLGEGIRENDILLWLDGNNLVVSISDSDTVIINNYTNESSSIEEIYLSNGLYMNKSTIDRVVSDIRLYASENTLSLNRDSLLTNPNILNIISSSWQKNMNDFTPPLVLDLNSNGITSSSLANSSVYFDYDGDGVIEKTAWIESGDAFLVYDKNNDGIISDGSELFGEHFKLSSGKNAKDGYEALKEFDSDGNGIINKLDAKFSELLIWQDTNLNGITDSGELKNLSDLGITSIGLPIAENFSIAENGNIITNKSTFTQNGLIKEIKDIWFGVDLGDARSSVRDDTLYDYDFSDAKIDSTIYVDDIKMLTQSEIKELIISSGYTGISTNGITAKANANDGSLTFENKWYKSDTLDTMYESSDGELKNSSGVVRDFVDAVNSNIALKNSIDNLGSNSNTISMDMDKILQDWVLEDSFLSNSLFLPPIVLDLNGNGTTSLSLDNTDAYFNYGEDYRRYKTAWIESGDAILGVDLNKDGIINSAFEVFGNKTKLKDGSFAKDGYRALKEFDSNKDGIINKNDDDFEKLVLWFDDGDAKGEAGELKTLSEVGINSISLIPKAHETLENGNKISFESNFTKDDKTSGVLRDVWFEVSGKQSIGISHLSDKDEKKISIVENFKGARLTNHQRANPLVIAQILDEYESIKYDMMSQILAKKLYGDNANTCTLLYNALNIKLSRVISGDATPDETALSINILASVLKKDFAYAIFKLNPNYLSNAKIKALLDKTGINFSINAKDLNSIKGIIGKNVFGDDEAEIFDFSNNKEGVNILSKGGNDILMGSNFHDKLNGGNGNDILLGNGGIDTLIGSGGNDLLIGSKYSTIYEYYLGDGDDIIYDDGGKDILKLNFLKVTDLSVGRVNDDMIISIINPLDKNSPFGSIIIKDGYKEGKIEEYFIGDKFYTIDEFLKAVPASNTYEFKKGSSFVEINDKGGIDKVIFGEGITPNDIITTKNGLNLEIAIKIDGRTYDELLDKLTINNFFTSLGESNGVGKIESFIFESGIILNSDEILLDEINNDTFIIGDEKDNELIGTNNPNIINGKSGNDILRGLNGDDTYIYEGGKDTIIDSGGNDKIVFGEGITRDNLQSKFIGDDLVIAIKESGARFEDLQNSITIKNQALDNNKIEKIMYSNGSEFDINTLKNREVIALKTISKTLQDIREINGVINASDEDSDTLTFELIEESKFGIFALNDDGSYTYKANDKFIGKDEAKVKISDGMGSEVVTTIKLNIVISAPKIDTTTIKFNEDSVLENSIKVSNPSNSKLTYELVGEAKSSVVVLNDDGNFMITPNLNYNGEDFITIKVTNEYGLSDIKTIALNINPINDAPEFKESISNYELTNTDKVIANLEAFDIDSNNLTYKVVSNPTNGFITIDKSGNFTYTSNKGYKGSDSVIVEVSDGELSTTKELKFNMNGYEYNSGNLEIPSNDLIDTTLKLPNLNVEDIKFNRSNNDLILTQNSGDITIKDYFTKGAKTIDTLIFKNNQTINIDNTKLVLPNKKSWQIKPSANLNNSGIIFSDLENSILNGSNKDDIIISTGDNSKIHAKDGNDTIILNGNKNEVYGSSKNDTVISNGKNNFLIGENGDDTYIIGKDANNTIIRDKEYVNLVDGGNDTLILNDIDKSSVEFKLGGSFNKDLIINYSNSHSKDIKTLTIQNQTNKYSAIENINLDGTMLGTETINKIIQDLNSYSDDKGLSLNFNSEFKNNDIMQVYNS